MDMDTDIETTAAEAGTEHEFAKSMGKTFAINAAATTGALAGILLVGLALTKLVDRKNRKKVTETETEPETTTEEQS